MKNRRPTRPFSTFALPALFALLAAALAFAPRAAQGVAARAVGGASCAAPSFTFVKTRGASPTQAVVVASADFNADGHLDLVTANDGGTVSLLNGDGAGNFDAPRDFALGARPQAMLVGDFNGDGRPDVSTGNSMGSASTDAETVSVLLGDGAGGFAPANGVKTGTDNTDLAAGDLDGDGKLDLAVTAREPAQGAPVRGSVVKVLFGRGDGTFGPAVNYGADAAPAAVRIADFNRDGRPDLLTVTDWRQRPAFNGLSALSLFLNNGGGGFAAPRSFQINVDASGLEIGDFDGDGRWDAVVVNRINGFLSIFAGDGTGGFGQPTSPTPALPALSLAVGDFDSDGRQDLGFNGGIGDPAGVLLGDETGRMSAHGGLYDPGPVPERFNGTVYLADLTAGDFNGDGKLDLATNAAGVMFGDGRGGLLAARYYGTGTPNPGSLTVADFNEDGRPDLVVPDASAGDNGKGVIATSSMSFMAGYGAAGFAEPVRFFIGFNPTSSAAGDFDGDAHLDLVAVNRNHDSLSVVRGDGVGNFGPPTRVPVSRPTEVATGDFNSDGKLDVAVVSEGAPGRLTVLPGTGTGSFGAPVFSFTYPEPLNPTALIVRDLNGDGRPDLAVTVQMGTGARHTQTTRGRLHVFVGDGAGGFTLASEPVVGIGPNAVTSGDFNGDGKLDLVTANANDPEASLLLGDGAGRFGPAANVHVGLPGRTPVAADFNLDGRADLAVTSLTRTAEGNVTGSSVSVLLGDGAGGFGTPTRYPGHVYDKLVVSDLDGDGRPDLLAGGSPGSSTNGYVSVLRNTCGGAAPTPTPAPAAIQFMLPAYLVNENTASVAVRVERTGDASRAARVDYELTDGTASQRSDYTIAAGTLSFAAGESEKSFQVLITNDLLVEGDETAHLSLRAVDGAALGARATALLVIKDDDTVPSSFNPLADPFFFVRQHYYDFLSREPDNPGLRFWSGEISGCADPQCHEVKLVHVSAAFFLSIEFQETGYLVYRMQVASYGSQPRYLPFMRDTQTVGRGVVVGPAGWQARLEANKRAFADAWVARPEFRALYDGKGNAQYVDALAANTGTALTQPERDALAAGLDAGTETRATVLRKVAENRAFSAREFNRAFVLMQYFGYLRRNPDDAPDSDLSGYQFWLSKLEEFRGDFVAAEMVKAFISSAEYRQRFGQ